MNYPFWDTTVGYGLLMAGIAVLHVFISHFAIGGGLYLVVSEHFARRTGDQARLDYLASLSKFFVLTTLVAGALTGVGIWFIIGLLNPAATEALIRIFVWGWATEWTFFVVEIAAAILYFYGWKRMTAAAHLTVGWIYFAAAWLSLFVINGILTFMLTPGSWTRDGSFWSGFFNPTFWPALLFRTGVCLALAGIYALLVASRQKDLQLRASLARYNAVWTLVGIAIIVPGFLQYWRAIPESIMKAATLHLRTPFVAIQHGQRLAAVAVLVLLLIAVVLPRKLHVASVVILMVMALGWFGSFEWFRESIRKPWIIYGTMYANGIEVSKVEKLQATGLLPSLAYRTGDDGADLFRHACRSCHTLGGYKALKPAFSGTDPAFVSAIIKGVHLLRGQMPPFPGTAAEADTLGKWIHARVDQRPLSEIYGLQGVELGQKSFEVRCAKCHVPGGVGDKTGSLAGLSSDDYNGMLDMASDLGVGMPAFTGDARERQALVQFLGTIRQGGAK
jgi:mono/diheme cytochrome c family protein